MATVHENTQIHFASNLRYISDNVLQGNFSLTLTMVMKIKHNKTGFINAKNSSTFNNFIGLEMSQHFVTIQLLTFLKLLTPIKNHNKNQTLYIVITVTQDNSHCKLC